MPRHFTTAPAKLSVKPRIGNAFIRISTQTNICECDYFTMSNTVSESNQTKLGSAREVLPDMKDSTGKLRRPVVRVRIQTSICRTARTMGKFNAKNDKPSISN